MCPASSVAAVASPDYLGLRIFPLFDTILVAYTVSDAVRISNVYAEISTTSSGTLLEFLEGKDLSSIGM
jgi:hypothetical protein